MTEVCRNLIFRTFARTFALRHCMRGALSVELALIAPIMLGLVAGTIELGRLSMEQVRLNGAARAGVQYGVYSVTNSTDTAGMIAAARYDANDEVTNYMTIEAAQICRCPDTTVQACSLVCADGKAPPWYVQVEVSKNVDLWFTIPGVPSSISLVANSSLRVR